MIQLQATTKLDPVGRPKRQERNGRYRLTRVDEPNINGSV
jgi:hypothetical protein